MRVLRAHEAREILRVYHNWSNETFDARVLAGRICFRLRKNGWVPTPNRLLNPVPWPAVARAIARIARSYSHAGFAGCAKAA